MEKVSLFDVSYFHVAMQLIFISCALYLNLFDTNSKRFIQLSIEISTGKPVSLVIFDIIMTTIIFNQYSVTLRIQFGDSAVVFKKLRKIR